MTTPRRPLLGTLVAVAVGALWWAPAAAQTDGPPPPLPLVEVEPPAVHERALANGARLLVVPHSEVPFVTVNVVLPGGSVADPPGREGTGVFVARLLERGAGAAGEESFATSLDRQGITLAISVAEESSLVSLNATTPTLGVGLDVLARLLGEVAFSAEQLELTRTQARTGLQIQASRAGQAADLAFLRAVHGEHPYGRLPTPASVSAIETADLAAYHTRWYRPDGALIVVAGDIDPEGVAARLEADLAGWVPAATPPPPIDYPRAPDRERPEIIVVHRPGAVQAEIRIGHLLMGGAMEGWEALVVANQVLGGGPSGRLQQVLRSALGYTYDARSTVARGRHLGLFQIATATRSDLAGATVEEVFRQVERLRTRVLPSAEHAARVSYLLGSHLRSIETPQQVASTLIEHRFVGSTTDPLDPALPALVAVDTAAVRAAAESFIRPEQFLVVVSGDAAVIQPQLRALGEVSIVDANGAPLTLADLRAPPSRVDLSALRPATLHYQVVVGGVRRGSAVRLLESADAGWRFASVIEAGVQRLEQEMVVDQAMRMVSSATIVTSPAGERVVAVRREGDQLVGERSAGDALAPVVLEVPEGVTLADGIELALWATPLEVGREIRLSVVELDDGTIRTVPITVEARTELAIDAGTFDTFRVVVGGDDPQIYHVLARAPHIPVRMESATRAVALELTALPATLSRR